MNTLIMIQPDFFDSIEFISILNNKVFYIINFMWLVDPLNPLLNYNFLDFILNHFHQTPRDFLYLYYFQHF